MIDIDSIDREIRLAHLELNDPTNVKGILPLAVRKRIWEAMLEPEDTEGTYRRRTSLRILCVEHVKLSWYRAFPHDHRIDDMIALTRDVVGQKKGPTLLSGAPRTSYRRCLTRLMTSTP